MNNTFGKTLSQTQLAKCIGCSPQAVSKGIKDMGDTYIINHMSEILKGIHNVNIKNKEERISAITTWYKQVTGEVFVLSTLTSSIESLTNTLNVTINSYKAKLVTEQKLDEVVIRKLKILEEIEELIASI